jgi:transcriptional regulator with XRE-family HTH domain
MYLSDEGRRKLLKLMVIQDVSRRALAQAAGWSSHSYMNRLLNGEVSTLAPEPAVRIATYLGVPVDDLFVQKSTSLPGRGDRRELARAG